MFWWQVAVVVVVVILVIVVVVALIVAIVVILPEDRACCETWSGKKHKSVLLNFVKALLRGLTGWALFCREDYYIVLLLYHALLFAKRKLVASLCLQTAFVYFFSPWLFYWQRRSVIWKLLHLFSLFVQCWKINFHSIISEWAQLQWSILLWSKQCMWQQNMHHSFLSLSLSLSHTHTHTPDTSDMPIRQVASSNNERTVNGKTEIGRGRYRHRAWQVRSCR